MSQETYQKAVALMDAANSEDPNKVTVDGKEWPKELLYSHRMVDMLERYKPDAEDAQKLAIRAQHIQRWKSARDAYPMDRQGYLKWRTDLYKFHAETAGKLLAEAGYDEEFIARVKEAVGKRKLKLNPDTQLLEDVTDLVFIEHYMLEFAGKHPEYSEEKWIDIMLTEEYGLSRDAPLPIRSALATFVAFLLAGSIPLLPFLLGLPDPFRISIFATLLTFFLDVEALEPGGHDVTVVFTTKPFG